MTARPRPQLRSALASYEADRLPRYATVRELSLTVEESANALAYAESYATTFSHWMLTGTHRR